MDMNNELNNETEQQENTEVKTFTQEEVDEIIKKRLARERKKTESEQLPETDREKNLEQRELTLMAKEKLLDEGMPLDLAGVLKFSDEKTLEEAIETIKNLSKEAPKAWGQRQSYHKSPSDPIADAFKPK